MGIIMYKNLIDVAKRIVAIANTREQNQQEGFFSLSNLNLSDYDVTYVNQLTEILMNLELDEVMALQTIMYLGRDKDYNSNLTSDEIFLDYKKYIESLGIKTKELEVRQMVEKMPLGKYITDGYAILGIIL